MSKSNHSRKDYRDRNHNHDTDMGEKLRNAVNNTGLMVTKPNGKKGLYRSADSWKGDGVDHINIDYYGETKLGVLLDFSNNMWFKHSIFEDFSTISGFWAYIRSEERHDDLRRLVGRKLQELSQEMTNRKVKHIRAMVMDAAYQRIKNNQDLMKMFFENELPFDMYRVTKTAVKIRPNHHDWVVDGYMEIQRAIQSNSEPNFTKYNPVICRFVQNDYFLCDSPTTDIYESVRPVIPENIKERFVEKPQKPKRFAEKKEQVPQQAKTTTQKFQGKQPKKDEYTFKKENGYSLIVPSINNETDTLFTKMGRKTVKINDIQIETGLVISGVSLPLLKISDHEGLTAEGLISNDDVVRGGPVLEQTFVNNFRTNNVIRLDQFAVENSEKESILFPVGLKLISKSFNRENDTQSVEFNDTGSILIKRSLLLYKSLDSFVTSDGEKPTFVKQLVELIGNRTDADKFRYAVINTSFDLNLNTDVSFDIYLTGTIQPIGISTGNHDDEAKEVIMLEDTSKTSVYEVDGYSFSLYRGKLRTETRAAKSGNIIVEAKAPTVEPLAETVVSDNETNMSDEDAGDIQPEEVIPSTIGVQESSAV